MLHTKTRKIILVVAVLALLGGGAFAYYSFSKDDPVADTTTDQNSTDFSPPTEEEQKSGDQQKQEIIDKEEKQQSNNNSSDKTASVIITDAGQYDNIIEVRSFIPDHYQDGTCTMTFTKGSQTVSKSTPAYRDATTTICTNPLFKRSEFPSTGDWQLKVSYSSKDAKGVSDAQTVRIK